MFPVSAIRDNNVLPITRSVRFTSRTYDVRRTHIGREIKRRSQGRFSRQNFKICGELEYVSQVLDAETWSSKYCEGQSWVRSLEMAFEEMGNEVCYRHELGYFNTSRLSCGCRVSVTSDQSTLTVIMDTTTTLHANAIPVYADIGRIPGRLTLRTSRGR